MLVSQYVFGQSIELRPMVSYFFRETLPIYSGYVYINDGASYGAESGYAFKNKLELNMLYSIQPTTVDIKRYPNNVADYGNKVSLSYVEMGCHKLHNIGRNKHVIPYTGAKAGVVFVQAQNTNTNHIARFSLGVTAGVKVMLSDIVGLNFFGILQAPVSGIGANAMVGTSGVNAGLSTYSYVVQFGLGTGLVIKLNH